jgi:murein DD-endopeptidase MepM/ murein hydrolase activator NlpD
VRPILAAVIACGVAASLTAAAQPVTVTVAVAARSVQPGEVLILTLTTSSPVDEVRVSAFGHDLKPFRTSPTQWRVLIGIDLDTKPGRYDVSISAGPSETDRIIHLLTVRPKTFPTRQLKVDPAFVNPPAEAMARIRDDAERLNGVWTSSSATRLWSGPFVRPVPDAANSAFGSRSVFNGEPRSAHGGADFSSPAGTPVKAPNDGRIALAGDLYFTGNTVVIDHGGGLLSLFAHLRAISVRESESVKAGVVVGEVGATGRVTGPHLHWTVRANRARVDPL